MALGPSFVDNPLVQALGSHLGMDGLFAQPSAATPPPPPKAPPVNEVSKVRESKAVRQSYPRVGSERGLKTGVGSPNMGMNLPGVMSPEVLQHPVVQQLLSQYGVSPEQANSTAQSASPDLFVDNAATARHPVMAGLLERGLEGLTFTHGSNTPGEAMTNIAQGLLNAKAARADKYNNQLMMPFAQAQQVAGLKGEAARQQFEAAQAARDQALVKHYADMDDTRQFIAEQSGQWHQQQEANRAMANHIRLLSDKRFSSLTPEQESDFNNEISQAGGLGKISDETFEKYAQMGAQNLFNAQEKGKNTRAAMSAGAHIAGAKISAGGRDSGHVFADAKATWDASRQALRDFDKNVATHPFGMVDPATGQPMKRKDFPAFRAKLSKAVDDAKTQMDSAAQANGMMAGPAPSTKSDPMKLR